jgi:hypothetical protein
MVTRGAHPFGRPGSTPRTCLKSAFSNIAFVPKNAKSSWMRLLSDRGYASTAAAPRSPA